MATKDPPPVERYRVGLELLGEVGAKKVLDAGCGFGTLERYITAFGVDRSIHNLRQAETKQGIGYLTAADLSQLPFEDEFFDIVIMLETLEHVEDEEKSLEEVTRVLKNQGQLILSVPNNHLIYNLIDWEHWLIPLVSKRASHRHYKKKNLANQLTSGGFKIDRCFERGMLIAACMRWLYAPFDLTDYLFFGGFNGPFGKMIRRIFDRMVDWEFRIKTPYGGSLFIVAHKECRSVGV